MLTPFDRMTFTEHQLSEREKADSDVLIVVAQDTFDKIQAKYYKLRRREIKIEVGDKDLDETHMCPAPQSKQISSGSFKALTKSQIVSAESEEKCQNDTSPDKNNNSETAHESISKNAGRGKRDREFAIDHNVMSYHGYSFNIKRGSQESGTFRGVASIVGKKRVTG